jgi:hypothetical protein
MNAIRDVREEKLPAWARRLIDTLRADAQYERTRAAAAQEDAKRVRQATNPDDSSAVLFPYDEVPVGLGPDARVRFKLGRHGWADVRVSDDGRSIDVTGGRTLLIRPQCGNVVTIVSEGW